MLKAALATIALLILSVASFAQGQSSSAILIRPDDILRIQLYGDQQVNVEVPVGEDGTISAPFAGTMQAAGKTTGTLEAELVDIYKHNLKLRDPKVSVTYARYRPTRASITGAVGHPGQYDFRPGDTILTLVALGGDVIPGLADLHRARLHRAGTNEEIPLDLYAMEFRGDLSQNYKLEDGDQLNVPADTRNNVKVNGFVQRPGQFPYREPMTLADAISQAGGEIPLKSMMSHVTVLREVPASPGTYELIRCDYVRYVKGDPSQNIELKPNDFIYVPPTNTPDLNAIGGLVNSAFFIDSILRNGLFGIRIFR